MQVLGYLHGLTLREDGVIIVGTILLFPTTATLYGGVKVFFAAREAVRRESREKGRQEGIEEGVVIGREEGREEGVVIGREEGRVEGRVVGIEEGRHEGRQEERERIIRVLLESGITPPPEVVDILNGKDR